MTLKIGKNVMVGKGAGTSTSIKIGKYVFGPSSISGLVGWFDMQDSTSFSQSGGNMVSITNKISSVVWNTAESVLPVYNSTGINNYPAMDFNGTTHGISSTGETVLNALFTNNNAFTVFYVAQHDTFNRTESVFSAARNATSGFKTFGQSA